ncbi:hypothetical protein [Escherichia coli]|uniref:hypothetical protein n=1 Tax=Escherichia coli TaxID=562 RepID=UPI000D5939E8
MALTKKQREKLRMKFGGRCAYCGCELTQVSLQVERGRRSSVNFRTAERFGLIQVVNKPVVFWFEQYQRESEV